MIGKLVRWLDQLASKERHLVVGDLNKSPITCPLYPLSSRLALPHLPPLPLYFRSRLRHLILQSYTFGTLTSPLYLIPITTHMTSSVQQFLRARSPTKNSHCQRSDLRCSCVMSLHEADLVMTQITTQRDGGGVIATTTHLPHVSHYPRYQQQCRQLRKVTRTFLRARVL